jgi:GH18 family chitinase
VAFVDPFNFTREELFPTPPIMSVSDLRQYFDKDTKVGIAVGGWGAYSTNFGYVSTQANRTTFAQNLASWVSKNGYDFVGEYLA